MTKRTNISCLTALGLFLAASPALFSQVTTGQISGRVTDNNGRPVVGARIVLTAPQLMGQREVTADANGEWRAALLPPGDYTIRFSANGFVGASAANVRVGVGSQLRQDRVLRTVATATETVDIVATDNTVVDKADTRTAVNYSYDNLQQLTGARAWGSAINFTAGTTPLGERSFRGGTTSGNTYRLNGVEIREGLYGQGWPDDFIVPDTIEDMAVVLSPTNARFGRAGGSVDVVTRSGGNEFSGTVRFNAGRNNWGSQGASFRDNMYNYVGGASATNNNVNDALNGRSVNVTLSGPIIKDRLWFSAASTIVASDTRFRNIYNYSDTNQNFRTIRAIDTVVSGGTTTYVQHPEIDALTAVTVAPHPITGRPWPTLDPATAYGRLISEGYGLPNWNYGQVFQNDYSNDFYNAKLTFQITPNHRLSADGHARTQLHSAGESQVWNRTQQMSQNDFSNFSWRVDYNGILGPSTFLEAKIGRMVILNRFAFGDTATMAPNWPAVTLFMDRMSGNPVYNNNLHTDNWGAFIGHGQGGETNRNNLSGSLNLTMHRNFWDMRHHIDTGIDFWQVDGMLSGGDAPGNFSTYVGGIFEKTDGDWLFPVLKYMGAGLYGQNPGNGQTGLAPVRFQSLGEYGTYKTENTALYFNDQVAVNDHWNVMVGLRYEKNVGKDAYGKEVLSASDISPRFTLTFDPKGDSSHVYKFNFTRIRQDFQMGLIEATSRYRRNSAQIQYGWNGAALPGGQPDPMTLGDIDPVTGQQMYGLRFVTLAQLVNPANFGPVVNIQDTGQTHFGQDSLKPMASTEVNIEYRRSYGRGSYFRTAYVYKWFDDIIARRVNYDQNNIFSMTVPEAPAGVRPMYSNKYYIFNDSSLWRDYNGFELETVTRINSTFTLNLNYTYSMARGNTYGGDLESGGGRPDYTTPRYTQDTYHNMRGTPMSQLDPEGALGTDYPHIANIAIVARVPVTRTGWVSYSVRMNYTSGRNFSLTGSYPISESYFSDTRNYYRGLAENPSNPFYPIAESGAMVMPTTWSKWFSARGAYHRNDTYSVNATITWEVPVYKKIKSMGQINISNIFNAPYHSDWDRSLWDQRPAGGSANYQLRPDRYGGYLAIATPNYDNFKTGYRSASLSMGLKF